MMIETARAIDLAKALIGVSALLLLAGACGGEEEPSPEATATTPSPGSVAVAREFVEALGAFDTERAAALLAPNADLSGMEGGREDWRRGIAWMEAQGFKLLLDDCDGRVEGDRVAVKCMFDYHGIRSDVLGRGPYGGSFYEVDVVDDRVVSALLHLEFLSNGFSEQMWKPFAGWLSANHPDDLSVMYVGDEIFLEALTEESIGLWKVRSLEYAEAMQDG